MKTKGVRYWKKKAWDEFSKYIRLRDAKGSESAICCTCGKTYNAFGLGCMQAGHYVPGRRNAYLFEEHNCHAQCYVCNTTFKGRPIEYREFMDRTYGKKDRKRIEALRFVTIKYSPAELEAIRDKYKAKYEKLKGE